MNCLIAPVLLYVTCQGVGNLAVCHAMRRQGRRWPWVAGGTAILASGYFVYVGLMRELPLSVVMPAGALNYLIIAALSRLVLRDRVTPLRWFGTLLVSIGVLVIMLSCPEAQSGERTAPPVVASHQHVQQYQP
jgi:drug/metabolite transporter (DMT)-like permease